MAIALDASSKKATGSSSSSPISWSHTCTGSNRILFVAVEHARNVQGATPTASVTYNGVAMTQIAYANDNLSYAGEHLFYLIAPATGSNTVEVTFSVSSGTFNLSGVAVSYTGALQSGQPDSYGTIVDGNANPVVPSTTVVAADCWLVAIVGQGNADPTGYNGVTTLRQRGWIYGTLVDSNGTVATGAQTLSVQYVASAGCSAVIASFAPNPGLSVSDSVTVSEAIQISYSLPSPVSESVTITEGIQISYSLPSPIFDSTTVSENTALNILVSVSVFDSVTVTENISLSLAAFSVFDPVTLSEDVSLRIPYIAVVVFDSITTTDNFAINPLYFVVFDLVTITESFVKFSPSYQIPMSRPQGTIEFSYSAGGSV